MIAILLLLLAQPPPDGMMGIFPLPEARSTIGRIDAQYPPHPCDLFQQREAKAEHYNPRVGVPIVGFFCGPPVDGPLTYALELDGVLQPSPGVLALIRFDWPHWPSYVYPTAGNNGLVPYATPGSLITLPTAGLHTVRVTYGVVKQVATFKLLGATCNPKPGVSDNTVLGQPLLNCL